MRVQSQLPHLDKHVRDMYHKGKPTWSSHTRAPVSMFHKVLQSCAVWSIYIDPLGGEGKVERILVAERERADAIARAGAPQLQCICNCGGHHRGACRAE